jgi:hypothetical protein
MGVVHRRLSLLGNGGKHVDYDDGFEPTTVRTYTKHNHLIQTS